jgi:hypothetical protein
MATVLEECATEDQRSAVHFLWPKGLSAKDIHGEVFPVNSGKCLSRKALHNWAKKFPQRRSKVADDARSGRPIWNWLRQQSKAFFAAGFEALIKRWDKCINVGGEYVEK